MLVSLRFIKSSSRHPSLLNTGRSTPCCKLEHQRQTSTSSSGPLAKWLIAIKLVVDDLKGIWTNYKQAK